MNEKADEPIPSQTSGLAWWRTLRPDDIRDRRDDLAVELVALSRGLVSEEVLGRAAIAQPEAGLQAVEELPGDSELRGSWLAWAAAHSDRLAALMLIRELERRIALLDRRPRSKRVASTNDPNPLQELIVSWLSALSLPDLTTSYGRLQFAQMLEQYSSPPKAEQEIGLEVDFDDSPAPPAKEELPPQLPDKPMFRVISSFGDSGSREGKALLSTYKPLLEPLPLAGGTVDPGSLRTALCMTYPWMADVVTAITDDMSLMFHLGEPWVRFHPLLIIGPPGIGKTTLALQVAKTLNTGFGIINAAGSADNRLLAGTARGWSSAQPALPLLTISRCGTANPIIVVDEIDKTEPGGHNGDIRQTLLTLLETQTAAAFFDECLVTACDLSQINWILTANDIYSLPKPLLSRLRVVRADRPRDEHFDGLVAGLLRDLASSHGARVQDLPPLEPEVFDLLRRRFQRRPDVRRLRAALSAALSRTTGRGRTRPHH